MPLKFTAFTKMLEIAANGCNIRSQHYRNYNRKRKKIYISFFPPIFVNDSYWK